MSFSFFASYIAIWILVLFQGFLILALLRQLTELRRLLEMGGLHVEDRLPQGSPAPEFEGFDARSGQPVGTRILSGRGGILLFLSPDCTVCRGLVASLRQPAIDALPPIIALCQGAEQSCGRLVKRLGPEVNLLIKGTHEIAARYRVTGSPTAVVVDDERKIRGYGNPQNIEDLGRLLSRSLVADSADEWAGEKPHLAVSSSKVS